MEMPEDPSKLDRTHNESQTFPVVPPAGHLVTGFRGPAQTTSPTHLSHVPALLDYLIPQQDSPRVSVPLQQTDVVLIDGIRYYQKDSQSHRVGGQPDQSMSSRPRFQRLVGELAEACTGLPSAGGGYIDIVSATSEPEEVLGHILDTWNRSKAVDMSGASTPKAIALDEVERDEDTSTKIKVTLIFNAMQANHIDALLGGHKILHIAQTKLERILGPEATKAKLPEIRNGAVVLQDVFPTTFSAIRKWLSGKAILHGLPDKVKNNPLRELVHIYVQAARWGHRAIVHDSVNNMPLLGSPFEFLETCAIVYFEACAGVAFRNFFKKGLPIVLGNSEFDHTDRVPGVLKQCNELATDFAETMLGLVSLQKYGHRPTRRDHQPFPAFTVRDPEPAWYQPHHSAFCACGLPECTCTSDSASVTRPSDTHTIPRRSGYVETAPPSEVDEGSWSASEHWAQHDGGAGWDYLHHPVSVGSIIPGPPMSIVDAEHQPVRPRNWSSAHLRQSSDWNDVIASENGTAAWDYPAESSPSGVQYRGDAGNVATGPHVQFRTPSQELVQVSETHQANAGLEARLREVEKKLSEAQLSRTSATRALGPPQAEHRGQDASSAIAARSSTAPRGKPLATSSVPPAPLLHPGVPPVGMPNYVPGYGYNRYVQVGNGVVHPTGPGPYGLAGRTMVATRNSNLWDCTLVFRTGEIIECVVPVEEGRSTAQHSPWNFSGQRLQGLCRTQAGSFPATYVREINAPPSAAIPAMGINNVAGTSATTLAARNAAHQAQPPAEATQASQDRSASTKSKIAQNVDTSWLQSSANPREASRSDCRRSRGSSTPTTAFQISEHKPGCPSTGDWKSPCTCDDRSRPDRGRGGHAWEPSSAWTNYGWDAPDESIGGAW